MGVRGYFLSESEAVVPFPVGELYGSNPIRYQEGDLVIETERGKRWVYKQFSRQVYELKFKVSAVDIEFFRELHLAVGGQETPFYFVADSDDSAGVAIYVRKEQNFEPVELDEPGVVGGIEMAFYTYTLLLTQEPTEGEIGA
jgi:hypothetical protein